MKLIWDEEAWDDYLEWQSEDKKTLKRINKLIKDIQSSPYSGLGKPEPLKHDLSGYCKIIKPTPAWLWVLLYTDT